MESEKFDKLVAASAAVEADAKGKPAPQRGSVACPLCGTGTISYVIRGPRAMQARCSTPNCIVMMG